MRASASATSEPPAAKLCGVVLWLKDARPHSSHAVPLNAPGVAEPLIVALVAVMLVVGEVMGADGGRKR